MAVASSTRSQAATRKLREMLWGMTKNPKCMSCQLQCQPCCVSLAGPGALMLTISGAVPVAVLYVDMLGAELGDMHLFYGRNRRKLRTRQRRAVVAFIRTCLILTGPGSSPFAVVKFGGIPEKPA